MPDAKKDLMCSLKCLIITFVLLLSQHAHADDNRKHYYTDIPGIEANVLIKTTTSSAIAVKLNFERNEFKLWLFFPTVHA